MKSESEQMAALTLLFTPEFKRNIRQLAKKYRSIKTDLEQFFSVLGQGQTPGDQIPGVQYEVYKARVKNSDNNKGKSGGYRIIYQRTENDEIVLVTIYSKSEQADVSAQEIREFILAHDVRPVTEITPINSPSEEMIHAEKPVATNDADE